MLDCAICCYISSPLYWRLLLLLDADAADAAFAASATIHSIVENATGETHNEKPATTRHAPFAPMMPRERHNPPLCAVIIPSSTSFIDAALDY